MFQQGPVMNKGCSNTLVRHGCYYQGDYQTFQQGPAMNKGCSNIFVRHSLLLITTVEPLYSGHHWGTTCWPF